MLSKSRERSCGFKTWMASEPKENLHFRCCCVAGVRGRTAYDLAKAGGHRKVMGLLDPVPWLLWWIFFWIFVMRFFSMKMPNYHSKWDVWHGTCVCILVISSRKCCGNVIVVFVSLTLLTLWRVEGDHKLLQHDADSGRSSGFRGPAKWPKLPM